VTSNNRNKNKINIEQKKGSSRNEPTNFMTIHRNVHWVLFLLVVVAVAAVIIGQIQKAYDVEVDLNFADASATTALRLSPTSVTTGVNQTFTLDVNLDPGGEAVTGVDTYITFNPAVVQVVDQNTTTSGVQVAIGTLFPLTSSNLTNNTSGQIQFSVMENPGVSVTASGRIATITFTTVASGSSNINFTHTLNATTDTNVTGSGVNAGTDRLTIVQNSTVTVDGNLPTVSVTAPLASASVTGTINLTANATDNIAVAGVQFKVDGANVGVEDTTSPYSVSWNSTGVSNGTHSITAVARDSSNNIATSAAISVTVTNTTQKSPTITLTPEGRTNKVLSGKVSVLSSTKAILQEPTFTTNSSGQATVNINILPQQVYLKVVVGGYLTRLMGPYDYSTLATTFTVPTLLSADLNSDNIINSLDFSTMNARWLTNDAVADINQDGLVNTIDFSWLSKNWFAVGEN
jgi:hypothetical protein